MPPDQASARAACETGERGATLARSADKVRILSDDWSTFNKIATVIDLNPVPGSSQVWLDVDGVKVVTA